MAADDPGHEALAHAPIVHTRKGSLERFSDAPLVAWVETFPAADGGRELRYSIVFSHEDGGTPLDRLMATWGRATDIELVYAVELDAAGRVRRAEYQGKDHVMTPFAGPTRGPPPRPVRGHEEQHGERPRTGDAARRARPVAVLARRRLARGGDGRPPLDARGLGGGGEARGPGRGRGRAGLEADPGPAPLRLPRGLRQRERRAARLRRRPARRANGGVSWHASDAGRPAFRVARSGCFRAAVALPRGRDGRATCGPCGCAPTRGRRAAARSRCPRGAGSARIERVNLLFGLGPDDRPGPSVFSWSGGSELRPDGPPLELAVE